MGAQVDGGAKLDVSGRKRVWASSKCKGHEAAAEAALPVMQNIAPAWVVKSTGASSRKSTEKVLVSEGQVMAGPPPTVDT